MSVDPQSVAALKGYLSAYGLPEMTTEQIEKALAGIPYAVNASSRVLLSAYLPKPGFEVASMEETPKLHVNLDGSWSDWVDDTVTIIETSECFSNSFSGRFEFEQRDGKKRARWVEHKPCTR